jgi:CTP:molybdopterin cytidylyltransferase MocA
VGGWTARPQVAGVLLAAGSGARFGTPKALVDTGSGPWVLTTLASMSGCPEVVVVLGAQADQVEALLPTGAGAPIVLTNPDHRKGMGSSLSVGLSVLTERAADAALIMLVDLPDVTAAVLDRVIATFAASDVPTRLLARAAYNGRPGHPVLIGREHFADVIAAAAGDSGARDYLADHEVLLVECGDIGGGRDVDTPAQL